MSRDAGPSPEPGESVVTDPVTTVVLATGNRAKLAEVRAILAPAGIAVRGLDDLPPLALPAEGDEYEANAVAKARAAAQAFGLPALGDDSGLEVDALGGRPGVRSARYGGPGLDDAGRVTSLLAELAGVPPSRRGARFVCVAAYVSPEGRVISARGECAGRLLDAPRGSAGFGYDPIFAAEGDVRALAELAPAEKDALSHRGRAFRALLARLREGG